MSLDEITTKYQQVCVKAVESVLNEDLQLALDKLGLDVILNAMLTQDMKSTEQVVFWEIA